VAPILRWGSHDFRCSSPQSPKSESVRGNEDQALGIKNLGGVKRERGKGVRGMGRDRFATRTD
jgi:hypothetical protein